MPLSILPLSYHQLTLLLPRLFSADLCFAFIGLLTLACDCRLVEFEATWAPGHPLAGSSEMRPAEERHSPLQHPQAGHPIAGISESRPAEDSQPSLQRPQSGLQVPHIQAQTQVHSLICALLALSSSSVVHLLEVSYGSICLLIFVSTMQRVCSFVMFALFNAVVVGSVNACHLLFETGAPW
jgi:hypothetical protein